MCVCFFCVLSFVCFSFVCERVCVCVDACVCLDIILRVDSICSQPKNMPAWARALNTVNTLAVEGSFDLSGRYDA